MDFRKVLPLGTAQAEEDKTRLNNDLNINKERKNKMQRRNQEITLKQLNGKTHFNKSISLKTHKNFV